MSFPYAQIGFWSIFPIAVLIVISGWVMILISAIKKLRSVNNADPIAAKEKDPSHHQKSEDDHNPLLQDWDLQENSFTDPAGVLQP